MHKQSQFVNYTYIHARAAAAAAATTSIAPNNPTPRRTPTTTAAAALPLPRGRPAALHLRLPPAAEPGGHRLCDERDLRAYTAGHHGGWVGLGPTV